MLEIRPGMYILGLWFVRHNPRLPVSKRIDWLFMVWKDNPTNDPALPWRVRYRIAHHASEGLRRDGAPVDQRSWYAGDIDGARAEETVLAQMDVIASALAACNDVPVDSVHVQGDSDKALALCRAQPWFHIAPPPSASGD